MNSRDNTHISTLHPQFTVATPKYKDSTYNRFSTIPTYKRYGSPNQYKYKNTNHHSSYISESQQRQYTNMRKQANPSYTNFHPSRGWSEATKTERRNNTIYQREQKSWDELKNQIWSPFNENQQSITDKTKLSYKNLYSTNANVSWGSYTTPKQSSNTGKKQSISSFWPYETFNGKKTLILDLDETWVHSAFKPFNFRDDMSINVNWDGINHPVHVWKRPYADEFLRRMANHYEIVIFTASISPYANPLLDRWDPTKKLITHRLFREHCVNNRGWYIKDWRKIGRDLKDMIIVDNNPVSYAMNQENGIPILTWHSDKTDTELLKWIPLLEHWAYVDDVRGFVKRIVSRNEVNFQAVNEIITNKPIKNQTNEYQNVSLNKTISPILHDEYSGKYATVNRDLHLNQNHCTEEYPNQRYNLSLEQDKYATNLNIEQEKYNWSKNKSTESYKNLRSLSENKSFYPNNIERDQEEDWGLYGGTDINFYKHNKNISIDMTPNNPQIPWYKSQISSTPKMGYRGDYSSWMIKKDERDNNMNPDNDYLTHSHGSYTGAFVNRNYSRYNNSINENDYLNKSYGSYNEAFANMNYPRILRGGYSDARSNSDAYKYNDSQNNVSSVDPRNININIVNQNFSNWVVQERNKHLSGNRNEIPAKIKNEAQDNDEDVNMAHKKNSVIDYTKESNYSNNNTIPQYKEYVSKYSNLRNKQINQPQYMEDDFNSANIRKQLSYKYSQDSNSKEIRHIDDIDMNIPKAYNTSIGFHKPMLSQKYESPYRSKITLQEENIAPIDNHLRNSNNYYSNVYYQPRESRFDYSQYNPSTNLNLRSPQQWLKREIYDPIPSYGVSPQDSNSTTMDLSETSMYMHYPKNQVHYDSTSYSHSHEYNNPNTSNIGIVPVYSHQPNHMQYYN